MMVIYLPTSMNCIGQSVFELQSRNEHVDRQMDIGHINLIGGLVTPNPPKKKVGQLIGECPMAEL